MSKEDILRDAMQAPAKGSLESHREAILVLREKGYAWREIATFLQERGIPVDHTKVFRFINRQNARFLPVHIPEAVRYQSALTKIPLGAAQKQMLMAHFCAPNRSITYTRLAQAAGYESHRVANRMYGQLGRDLGEELEFNFAEAKERLGEVFYSSALGMENPYVVKPEEFQLVMHHELAKAIDMLGWQDPAGGGK